MRGYRIYNNQGNGHFTSCERAHTNSMVTPKTEQPTMFQQQNPIHS